jgi:hypothetical protein
MNEVSEHEGVLLVRLGRGSAMQVRFESDGARALFRIVPIARARELNGEAPWYAASEAQLQAWIDSDSAVGHWLASRLDREKQAAATGGWLLSAL